MRRKYFVRNSLTGYICFNCRRFWTAKGATRQINRSAVWQQQFMELHKII